VSLRELIERRAALAHLRESESVLALLDAEIARVGAEVQRRKDARRRERAAVERAMRRGGL
jgi:hypothetical protein